MGSRSIYTFPYHIELFFGIFSAINVKFNLGVDGAEGNVGDILPFTSDAKSQSFANKFKQPSTFNDDNFKDFIAGDTRVEENPYLASFHTIFVRYHNLIVDGLKKERPGQFYLQIVGVL